MPCPFCSYTSHSISYLPDTFFNKKIFSYVRCKACDLIFIDPLPQSADLLLMYPTSYQNGIHENILKNPFEKLSGLRFSYGIHFNLLKKYTDKKKMLDFGCGNANFLLNAKHQGFLCDGVEFNSKQVEILKHKIGKSSFYTVEEYLLGNSDYDIIRLSNVLEHLENPTEIIQKLVAKLKANGILLVEGPIETNFSLAFAFRKIYFSIRKYIQKNWTASHHPTHLFFSNSKNQRTFFQKFNIKELHFKVSEAAWPFPEKLADLNSLSAILKYCIAHTSIFFSKISHQGWGNTFIYVGRKADIKI